VRLSSILLRLLLCLSLVLNGSGYAAAAAKMRFEHAAAAATLHEGAETEATPPCPEHGDGTTADEHGAAPESV